MYWGCRYRLLPMREYQITEVQTHEKLGEESQGGTNRPRGNYTFFYSCLGGVLSALRMQEDIILLVLVLLGCSTPAPTNCLHVMGSGILRVRCLCGNNYMKRPQLPV